MSKRGECSNCGYTAQLDELEAKLAEAEKDKDEFYKHNKSIIKSLEGCEEKLAEAEDEISSRRNAGRLLEEKLKVAVEALESVVAPGPTPYMAIVREALEKIKGGEA